MGIIKDLLSKIEQLENMYKILQGKFDKLKIDVDLVNTKSKQLPDALTYKPQQPYVISKIEGVTLQLIFEGNMEVIDFSENYWTMFFKKITISEYDLTKTTFICTISCNRELYQTNDPVHTYASQIIHNNALYIHNKIQHTGSTPASATIKIWALTTV